MKTKKILILVVLLIFLANCKKDKNEDTINCSGINFCSLNDNTDILVNYNEISGYDSTKYIFRLDNTAWKRLWSKITPIYPDPHFGFIVRVDNQIMYTAYFIPGYYSLSDYRHITFMLSEPDLVYITLGYPSLPTKNYEGADLRNDLVLINQLKKDNKLIKIEK